MISTTLSISVDKNNFGGLKVEKAHKTDRF
jgi:hypothetical protein